MEGTVGKRDDTTELGGALSNLLKGLPHSGARKIAAFEAMQILWESLPEELQSRSAPREIHYLKNDEGIVRAVCEVWVADRMTSEVLKRRSRQELRNLAEKLGKVLIEDLSYRVVSEAMLRRQIASVRGY